MRSAGKVAENSGKAARAAATAMSTSYALPETTDPITCSVTGLTNGIAAAGLAGIFHAPSI